MGDSDDDANKHDSQLLFDHKSKMDDLGSVLQVKPVENAMMNEDYGGGGGGMGGNDMDDMDMHQNEEPEMNIGLKKKFGGGGGKKAVWGDHVGRDEDSSSDDPNGVDLVQQSKRQYDEVKITVSDPFSNSNKNGSDNRYNVKSPVPVAVKQNKRSRPKTEKEMQADLLFGGGASKSPVKRKVRKKRGIKKAAPKKKIVSKKKKAKQVEEEKEETKVNEVADTKQTGDLLDFMNDAPSSNTQSPQQKQKQQPPPADDLLGDLFSNSSSTVQSPAPSTNNQSGGGGGDLLGDLFGGSPSSSNVASNANNASSPVDDIFGGSLGSN